VVPLLVQPVLEGRRLAGAGIADDEEEVEAAVLEEGFDPPLLLGVGLDRDVRAHVSLPSR